MTKTEQEEQATALQAAANAEIAKRCAENSHHMRDQIVDAVMLELAPNWDFLRSDALGQPPRIMLTQYRGGAL